MPSFASSHMVRPAIDGIQSSLFMTCGFNTSELSRKGEPSFYSAKGCSQQNWWWAIPNGGDTTWPGRRRSPPDSSTPTRCHLGLMRISVCFTTSYLSIIRRWQRVWEKSVLPGPNEIVWRPATMEDIKWRIMTVSWDIPPASCGSPRTCSILPSIRHKNL